ncbi:hypothetical protein AGLY_013402 [Aphis glycines]|uniref:Uncharacterized protein n=1 Tax=Aphis glycines TaxID=307491 RepID=A0A6G0T683_APHGL|nr:hypothetical protein AGLY_013402 [Aphis glycines]
MILSNLLIRYTKNWNVINVKLRRILNKNISCTKTIAWMSVVTVLPYGMFVLILLNTQQNLESGVVVQLWYSAKCWSTLLLKYSISEYEIKNVWYYSENHNYNFFKKLVIRKRIPCFQFKNFENLQSQYKFVKMCTHKNVVKVLTIGNNSLFIASIPAVPNLFSCAELRTTNFWFTAQTASPSGQYHAALLLAVYTIRRYHGKRRKIDSGDF